MSTIKSIVPVQVPGSGWNVRVRTQNGDLYLTAGAPYTLAQAQVAAQSLARDVSNHGADHVCGGLLIGLVQS